MTSERDFDHLARAWLELGPDEAPDRVVAAVLQAAETTPQVRRQIRWPIWRLVPMNRLPVAAGAAVILVAAVGGAILLNRDDQSGVGGPPIATPTASPSPTPLGILDIRRVVGPGTFHVSSPFGAPFAFTAASPWTVERLEAGQYSMTGGGNAGAYLLIDLVENVFADPCQDVSPLASPVPRTVDGIIAGLDAMKDFDVSNSVDIEIDGHPGKEFDLTNAVPATAACVGGGLISIWTYPGGQTSTNPGLTEHIILVDVDGTPVGLAWGAGQTPTDAFRQEVDRMVRNLDFE